MIFSKQYQYTIIIIQRRKNVTINLKIDSYIHTALHFILLSQVWKFVSVKYLNVISNDFNHKQI
jgi:hypothetical protein